MSERRIVTLRGGRLDGREEPWEAGQTRRSTYAPTNWGPFPDGEYVTTYGGTVAFWHGYGETRPPSSNDVLRSRKSPRLTRVWRWIKGEP